MGQLGGRVQGSLAHLTKKKKRSILALSVVACEGVLKHVAFELGYGRRQIYRLIEEHHLWPIVNDARVKKLERAAIERRRM